jgi:hypothetical protein
MEIRRTLNKIRWKSNGQKSTAAAVMVGDGTALQLLATRHYDDGRQCAAMAMVDTHCSPSQRCVTTWRNNFLFYFIFFQIFT